MRNLITFFIRYSVPVNILIVGIVILGWFGISSVRSSFFPLAESKNILINITFPGASPAEIEEGVVLKIEDNLRGLEGIDRFTSTSSENTASINVEVLKDYATDVVLPEVKNAVDRIPSFPVNMEPPVVAKQESLNRAITFSLNGEAVPLITLKQIARSIENDLRNKPNISQVEVSGFPEEEIDIAVNEEKLQAYDITFREVSDAINGANIIVTGGSVKAAKEEYLIRVDQRSYYARGFENLIVKRGDNGSLVRLKDVSTVQDRWTENPQRSFFNGKNAVSFQVFTTNSEDLISASETVVDYVQVFNERNDNLRLDVTANQAIFIKERTKLLLDNGGIGILLVIFFLSLFLKPRLAFWVAFGLPISFLGMFIFVDQFDVTMNVLSLFGMIIVIGILVDDGIIIAENIYAHYEQGKNRMNAAIDGTMEVLPAIVSAVTTTILAFGMFLFLDGRIGAFFGEVGIVVFLTLAVSLVEALILLPSHVAHSKVLTPGQKEYAFNKWSHRLLVRFRENVYIPVLKFTLNNMFIGFAVVIALVLITMGGFKGGYIKGDFFPPTASERISIQLNLPEGSTEVLTAELIDKIERESWAMNKAYIDSTGKDSLVLNIVKELGPSTSSANLTLNLISAENNPYSAAEIAAFISDRVGEVPEAESVIYTDGTSISGKNVKISILSSDITALKQAKKEIRTGLYESGLVRDIEDNDPQGIKEIKLTLTDKAYLLGYTLDDVISQVRSGFFGIQAQRFQRGEDEVIVWVRYERAGRSSISDLDRMRVVNARGDRVPLSEIANYTIARGEVSINHLNGQREIRIDANRKDPTASSAEVNAELIKTVVEPVLEKYPQVSRLNDGGNREAQKLVVSLGDVGPIILILIYIVIAFTFRSYSQPIILLLMVPFTFIAVSWGHYIHGFPVNILSALGIIALIGIVVNDGLVFIAMYNKFLKQGMAFKEALIEAGRSRFRAIFLTSVTTVAGLAPLMLETSRNAKFLIPMAIAISYGIAFGTLLTLIFLPMLLSCSNWLKFYLSWLWEGEKPVRRQLERAVKEQRDEALAVNLGKAVSGPIEPENEV